MASLDEQFKQHTHNGSDSKRISIGDLDFAKQSAITAPSGGGFIDTQARTAINEIITALENLGFVIEN